MSRSSNPLTLSNRPLCDAFFLGGPCATILLLTISNIFMTFTVAFLLRESKGQYANIVSKKEVVCPMQTIAW